jgi:hypothetical protein
MQDGRNDDVAMALSPQLRLGKDSFHNLIKNGERRTDKMTRDHGFFIG